MHFTSITEITRVIETGGSYPVVVQCNDDLEYVCKYDHAHKLFNELIGASFLQIWDIPVPDFAIVQVKQEHIPAKIINNRVQPNSFLKPCFGSRYLIHAQDITAIFKFLIEDKNQLKKVGNKSDFLKIALFDLWVANTDRNRNNHNLLFNPEFNCNVIYAIDHSDIFDGCRLGNELASLTFDDSILSADFAKLLIPKKDKLVKEVDNLIKDFYICTKECQQNVENIFVNVPKEWKLAIPNPKDEIIAALFENEHWKEECITLLRQYITRAIS